MSRACAGAVLLARGVVSSSLAAVTLFESTWGIWVFLIRSDFEGKWDLAVPERTRCHF